SHVDVTELAVSGARGTLVQGPDGLNLIGILPAGDPDAPKKELPVSIEIQRAALDGVLTYDADGDGERPPYALEDLDLAGSFAMAAGRIEPRIQRLGMRAVEPPLGPLTLSGFAEIADGAIPAFEIDLSALDASVRSRGAVGPLGAPELDLNLVVEELQPERLAPLAELPLTGPLGLDADIRGPLTALQFVADLTAPRGGIHLDVTTDVKARPLTYAGTLDLDQLDLASFLDIRIEDGNTVELPSDLSGRVEVDAQGTSRAELSGTLALDLADSRWRDYEVDRLVLQAAIAPDLQVTFDRLSVQAPMGGAELHGRVRVPEQRFAVAGTLADVDLVGIGARTGVAELGGVAQGLLDAGGGWGGASGFWIEGDGQLRVAGLRTPATRVASLTVAFDAEAGGVALRDLGFAVDLSPTTARGEVTASRDEQLSLRALALVDWSQDLKIATDLLHIEAYGSVWDNDGIAQVTLGDAGAIEVHGVDLRGEDGRLTAEGVIAREGTSDFEAHAERLQLAALQPILPEDALRLRGAVGVDLKLSGPAGMPSVNLQLQGAQFVYGDYGPFGLEVGMVVAGGLTTVVANAGGPDIEPLTLQGILPYTINLTDPGFDPDSILQLFAEIPLQDAGNLGHVLPQATSLPPGKFGITLSVGGSGRNPTAVAGLVLRGVDLVGLPPMMADLDGRAEGGQIAVEGRLRDARAQLLGLTLDGDLDLGRWLLDRLGSGEDGDPPGGKPPGP
ncbi:MAG: hypothetical protein QGH45_13760, partial [Myxococcota bacterium]|nr:hypothetical protein [Myxococcota bacterium]